MINFRILKNYLYVKKVKNRIKQLTRWALILKPLGIGKKLRVRYFILKKLKSFFFFPFFTNFFLMWDFKEIPKTFLRYYSFGIFFDKSRLLLSYYYLPFYFYFCVFYYLFFFFRFNFLNVLCNRF